MNTLTVLSTVGGLFGAGGGGYMLLTLRATRRKVEAEAEKISAGADQAIADTVKVLIGGAADLVEPLKRQLRETNAELHEHQVEFAAVRREHRVEMAELNRGFRQLDAFMHKVLSYIHTPDMEMDRLRILVPLTHGYGTATNGRDVEE